MRASETSESEATADVDLVLRSRSGDSDAFGELWQRHYRSAIVAARSISPGFDADDLVQESYAKIFQAIRRGGGPTGSFRAYLFTAIRNTAAAWGRSRREDPADELDALEDPETSDDAVDAALDRSLTATAFRSLPSRWQEVLWYTEVERMKPAEVAPLLGLKPAAVSQLAFRAREGLRESWIQAHLASADDGSDCQWTIERLGARTRGNLGSRDAAKADAHIADCTRCTIVAAEAKDVGSRLVLVLLPLAVGVTGAAGYLATLQRGGEAVALMAMPAGVVSGTGIVTGETVSAELAGHGAELFGHAIDGGGALIGAAAGGAGAAGSSSGTSTGGSAGGSTVTLASVVAAGAASLLVAGLVAAASILPDDAFDNAAGEQSLLDESVPATSEIEPDDALAARETEEDELEDELIEQDAPEDDAAPDEEPAPREEDGADDAPVPVSDPDPSGDTASTPDPAPSPEAAPTQHPEPEPEPTPDPVPTPDPEPTPSPEPSEPEPEPTEPEPEPTEPEPALPAGTPTVTGCSTTSIALPTTYELTISGEPGASVGVRIRDDHKPSATIGDDGIATVSINPTLAQLGTNAPVLIRYELGDQVGPDWSIRLRDIHLGRC